MLHNSFYFDWCPCLLLCTFWRVKRSRRAVDVAQLEERVLPIPEICGSNPVIGKILLQTYLLLIVEKKKKKKWGLVSRPLKKNKNPDRCWKSFAQIMWTTQKINEKRFTCKFGYDPNFGHICVFLKCVIMCRPNDFYEAFHLIPNSLFIFCIFEQSSWSWCEKDTELNRIDQKCIKTQSDWYLSTAVHRKRQGIGQS